MPLQIPNLDDRRFNDLVAEALANIPVYSPEWTNYNPSDPGITLVELFAYLGDMLLYRLNRVTDANVRKFLKLLNGPDWTELPGADLREEIREAVLGIRERYRAVTRDDYEFLSKDSFNQWLIATQQPISLVARAHCVPQRNLDAGTEADRLSVKPEHVSVVIVPALQVPNPQPPPQLVTLPSVYPDPQPSAAQLSALFSYLDERRMLTTKLHVTGAFYVHVSVQLVIARNSDALDNDVKNAVNTSIADLLNPLPSDHGEGWPFGHDVFVSQIYDTLETIAGIDFVTDVMLSSSCNPGDNKCVIGVPIPHEEGDLVGLSIQDHHLPVFDHADMVIAVNTAFIQVRLSVTAQTQAGIERTALKGSIKSTVRTIFHPALNGPGPLTPHPTDIFLSDIQVAIRNLSGIADPVTVVAECVPAIALQHDTTRGFFVHVATGNVVDWQVTIQLN
jgi:hypothetical protein